MQFFKNTNFDFISYKKAALGFSGVLLLLSVLSLFFQWLNLSIDFTGGTLVEVSYPHPIDLSAIRQQLNQAGLDKAQVQYFGSSKDILIRSQTAEGTADFSTYIFNSLSKEDSPELRRVEYVGPQVGKELRDDGGVAMIYALVGILIYVAFRFEMRFALGAVLALIHDVILTVGFFSLTRLEFNLPALAAVLAVIGYSLNDTIVLYDRVRETFLRTQLPPVEVINRAVNLTLGRTIITSLTTAMVLVSLIILGGGALSSFAIALLVGVIVGTYSSIYVASLFVLMLGIDRKNLIPPPKEGEKFGRP